MKHLTLIFSTLLIAGLFSACNNNKPAEEATTGPTTDAPATTYTINTDSSSSYVFWKGNMIGVYEHHGKLNFSQGSITTTGGQLSGGSFTVDMTTIAPTDKNYDTKTGKTAAKLAGHFSSPDFFDVTAHPTATFTINSVNGSDATGTLSIRGKENEETVRNILITEEGETISAKGTLTFDRQKYGVTFTTGVKDKVISDEIVLEILLAGKKQ